MSPAATLTGGADADRADAAATVGVGRATRVVARLKVRLLLNGLRQGGMRRVAMSAAACVGLLAAVGGSVAIVLVGRAGGATARAGAVVGFAVLTVGWCLAPLFTVSADETLDPARLCSLPLRRRELLAGLGAAAAIGIGPVTVWVLLAAVIGGYVRDALTAVVVPIGVVLGGALSLVAARAIGAMLARVMASRRGRDVAVSIITLLLMSIALLQLAVEKVGHAGAATLQAAARWVAWTPVGWVGKAIAAASQGRVALAAGCLAATAGLVALCAWWWATSLRRAMVDEGGGAGGARRAVRRGAPRGPTGRRPAILGRLPAIPATPWGAVTAREARYVVREPRRRVQLLVSVILGVAFPLSIVLTSQNHSSEAVLVAGVGGYLVVFNTLNQFGLDGAAGWVDVVVGNRLRELLIGKNVAVGLIGFVLVAAAALVLAVYTGGWELLPASVLLGGAALAVGLGVADVTSVLVPVPLPEQANPFAGAGAGQGCVSAPLLVVSLLVQGLLLAPLILGEALLADRNALVATLVAVVGVAYGVALWTAGVRVAVAQAGGRQPELLEAVDPRRRA